MAKTHDLPHAPEAEISVLGGILIDNSVAEGVFERLSETDFFQRRHGLIYSTMVYLSQQGTKIDPVTLGESLTQQSQLEAAGGYPYLAELLDAVPTAANIDYHVDIVLDRSARRRLYEAAVQTAREATNGEVQDVEELLDRAERRILRAAGHRASEGPTSVRDTLWDAVQLMESGGVKGVPSGLADLDAMTGGAKPGNLILIAGATSMGKSAIALQWAAYAAAEKQVPTAIFSIEMTRTENTIRMLAQEAMADLDAMIHGRVTESDMTRIEVAARRLHPAPLFLDDSATRALEIRARARRLKKEHGLGLIIVDHIHDMNGEGESRREEVGKIGRDLKQLAKELDVPVIALSQLSRAPTTRPDRRPQLSDLRESGDLEAVANLAILMYRPEYYFGPTLDGEDIRGKAEAIVAKNRNGPTGRVDLYYRAHCTRFEDLSPREDR